MENGMTELVSAGILEQRGILRKGTAFRMAKAGLIPSYFCGTSKRGVRFKVDEVLSALKRQRPTTETV
jgi:hypothetical protein